LEQLGGLAGINCHCQWGLTGLLGGIVIMLAAGQGVPKSEGAASISKLSNSSLAHLREREREYESHFETKIMYNLYNHVHIHSFLLDLHSYFFFHID